MISSPSGDNRLIRFYVRATQLYPRPFRNAYAPAMQQTLRDALHDRAISRRVLVALIFRDLTTSLVKEHLAMLRDTYARPILIFNALVLTALATGLALALHTIPQQVLRLSANDPQIALADDLVAQLEQGVAPAAAVPATTLDMARSLSPFVIVYDDQGNPLASQAKLNGTIPVPPAGVFDQVRQRGAERLSWQPVLGNDRGVRIATVLQRVNGAHPGFVLAGRNMREVEAREKLIGQLASLTWVGMMGVILAGTLAFGWYTRPKTGAPV